MPIALRLWLIERLDGLITLLANEEVAVSVCARCDAPLVAGGLCPPCAEHLIVESAMRQSRSDEAWTRLARALAHIASGNCSNPAACAAAVLSPPPLSPEVPEAKA